MSSPLNNEIGAQISANALAELNPVVATAAVAFSVGGVAAYVYALRKCWKGIGEIDNDPNISDDKIDPIVVAKEGIIKRHLHIVKDEDAA